MPSLNLKRENNDRLSLKLRVEGDDRPSLI